MELVVLVRLRGAKGLRLRLRNAVGESDDYMRRCRHFYGE